MNFFYSILNLPRVFAVQQFNSILDGIEKQVDMQLNLIHRRWQLNFIDSVVLESTLLGVALVSHFFLGINDFTIYIISLFVLGLLCRSFVIYFLAFRNVWKNRRYVEKYGGWFWEMFRQTHIFSQSAKTVIRKAFYEEYEKHATDFAKMIHDWGSYFGVIPSKEEFANRTVNKFYPLIKKYTVELLLYQIGGITVAYAIFLFVLKTYVFGITVHLGFWQVVFFPFTVVLPTLLRWL